MDDVSIQHIYVLYLGRRSRDELEAACVLAASDPTWHVVVLLPETQPLPQFELAMLEALLRELSCAHGVEIELRSPTSTDFVRSKFTPEEPRRGGKLRSSMRSLGRSLRRYGARIFTGGRSD